MNIIILSPHFSHNLYQFCLCLRNLGLQVLAIGDTAYDQLPHALTGALTEYYKVESMANYDEVLRATGYFTHKYGKVDVIENMNPGLLPIEASLRTDFNVKGINRETADLLSTYTGMKKLCRKARANTLLSDVILSGEDATAYLAKTGYPVMAMPDSLLSQAPCSLLHNETELNSWLDKTRDEENYVLAPYAEKPYYSFDGLVDADGNLVFSASHILMGSTVAPAFYSLKEIPEDLEKVACKLLAATNCPGRFFHIRFTRNEKNKPFVEKLLLFPANRFMLDVFNFANDINIYQEWANVLHGRCFNSEVTRKFHCAYIARSAGSSCAHEVENSSYGHLIVADFPDCGTDTHQSGSSHIYLARSEDLAELLATIECIRA